MSTQLQLLPGAIAAMMADASETGVVTLCDRYGLLAAVLDERLSEEEHQAINRLLRSIVRGRLHVTTQAPYRTPARP